MNDQPSHRFITLERIIKGGVVNFFRNLSLSIAATAVMVVTLTIVLFSVIANATFNNTIAQINEKIDVSVYLKDSVTDEQRIIFRYIGNTFYILQRF